MKEREEFRRNIVQLEGGATALFMIDSFQKHGISVTNKKILEIGPKHGLHTVILDKNFPQKITCVDLINKKDAHQSWISAVSGNVEIVYEDILRYSAEEKFDVILCAGVIYHNTEQLRILKKLWSLAADDAYLMVESATIRDPELQNKNVIQVHWPDTYRGVAGVIFHPSKEALISMIQMSGWEVVENSDSNITPEANNIERINLLCKKNSKTLFTYEGIDHTFV